MEYLENANYKKGFFPYALAAFLVGIVGGLSTVLGPAFGGLILEVSCLGLGANAAILMQIVLSDLPTETAGTVTGIYGLFRDLAAPFGVAVFVPMFTNEISHLSSDGTVNLSISEIAVNSIHMLAIIELSCVAVGIFVVQLLPKIYKTHHSKGE